MDGEVRGSPVGQHLQEGRPDQERETRYMHALRYEESTFLDIC
jgi:hypothetical protein